MSTSNAIEAKTARARAGIAARMLKRTKTIREGGRGLYSGRSFDNCFEMGDGDEVVRLLLERARRDPSLVQAMIKHGFTVWAARVNQMVSPTERKD